MQSLAADGITIHEGFALPDGRAEYFTFQLPVEAYSDGEVTLSFDLVSGPDVLVSEIFIVKTIGEKEDAVRDGNEWLKTHQSDTGGWSRFTVTQENAISLRALVASGNTHTPAFDKIKNRVYELQATNGSWDNNRYSTFESVMALLAAGEDANSEVIRNGVNWIKSLQEDDGSWAEEPRATGMAIKTLIDAGEDKDSTVIQSAKQWLIDNQNADGFWGSRPGYPSDLWRKYYPVVGLVLASSPDDTVEQDAIDRAVNYYRSHYDSNKTCQVYSFLNILKYTNGPAAEISDVTDLLKSQQQSDGGWVSSNASATPLSDAVSTGESLIILSELGETGQVITDASQWINNNTTSWGDLLSLYEYDYETALSCSALNFSDPVESSEEIENVLGRIVETQHSNGSWGVMLSSSVECHVTPAAHLLWALGVTDVDVPGKDSAISLARSFIFSTQQSDGGWYRSACSSSYPSEVSSTCFSLQALLSSGVNTTDSRIVNGINWLMSQREGSGEWDNIENTSLAVMVLEKAGGYQTEMDEAVDWLKGEQNPDGGWGSLGSIVIDTALAIIAMSSSGNEGLQTIRGMQWLFSLKNSDGGWASVPGIVASNTKNSAYATWALAVSKYQMDIELELIFNKPHYYPGDLVKMAVNQLNAKAGSLILSGTVMEYEGEALPLTVSQNGDTFSAWHLLGGDHLPGTDMVNIVASGDEGQGSVTGSFVVKNGEGILPDVSVVSDDIDFSPQILQEGEPVTIVAAISNSEIRDAVNVTVRCYDGYPGSGGILIGEESVERISGLSTAAVSFDWQLASGMHEIYLLLDPDDTLLETNEQNNQAYKTIDIYALASDPDLSVAASCITLTPSDPTEGEEVLIEAVVHNLGGSEATDILVRFFDGNPDEPDNQIGEEQTISFLSSGESEVVEAVWDTLGELGRNYLHVVIDPEDSIEETKENNNEAIKIVDIEEFSRPDLALSPSDISFVPFNPLEGEEVTISATIHNRGKPAQNIKVGFYDGDPEDDGVLIKDEIVYSTISTGESEILEVSWETVGIAESHDIYVVVDPEEMIVEENEGNNEASADITVESSELVVEISLDRIEYEAEEDVSIETVITNLTAEQRVVTFDLLVVDSEGNVVSELVVSETVSLNPSMSVTRELVWNTGSRKAGEYAVVAVINENGTPRVTDSADFIIIADVSLSAEVITDRMVYFSYEQVKITSAIRSFSTNYTFSGLNAELTLKNSSDEILHSADKSIATLLPLDSFKWDTYWNTQTSPPGEYSVVLEVTGGESGVVSDLKSFSILPSYEGEMALRGSLNVDPAEVDRGDDILLSYEVENIGNAALPEVNLLFQVVHVETEDFITALNAQCSLDLGESCNGSQSVSTLGMPAGECLMALLGEIEGLNQTVAFVPLTVINQCPVADGGEDRLVTIGETVVLDGSGSLDPDGGEITYSWSLVEKPQGSGVELLNPNSCNTSITPDLHGDYLVQLVVSDDLCESEPDTVLVTTENRPPVADAGYDQIVSVGATVSLNGGASADPDGDAISGYQWIIVSRPDGSTATLSDAHIVNPTFVADLGGEYIIELTVSDWELESEPDRVMITANQLIPLPPDLLEDAISLEEEAVSLLSENGDLQEARGKIQTAISKLQEITGLLSISARTSINIRSEEDFPGAMCYLNMAIYFDKIALRLIRRDRPWRRRAAIANLMIANWFKGRALEIIE